MKLQITKEYRIASDSRQWMIQKYTGLDKKTGEQVWQSIAYYSETEKLVKGLIERAIRDSDARTLADALRDIEKVSHALSKALKEVSA